MENKETKNDAVDKIIQNHVVYSMTAGAIPIPLADFVAVSAVQVDMLKQIADVYGVDYDKNSGKSLASSLVGTSLSKMGASAIKAIPGIGTLAGVAAQVILSGASTYALGWVFNRHFAAGGTLSNFSSDAMKETYDELLKKGKDVAKNLHKDDDDKDGIKKIEKLKEMLDKGLITEEEYEKTKKDILEKMST